jgi:hypothetical protein
MSGRYRYDPPPRLPAQRPPRLRKRDEQAIPKAPDVFAWRPNVELVVGVPRADRRAKDPRNA